MNARGSRRRPWLLRSAAPVNRDDFPPIAEKVIPFPPNWVLVFAVINSSLFSLHLRFLPPAFGYGALAFPFVLFFAYIAINGLRAKRLARRARRAGLLLCTNCAYDMRDSIGRWECPECGHPWEHEDAMRRWGVFIEGRLKASDRYDLDRRKRLIDRKRRDE